MQLLSRFFSVRLAFITFHNKNMHACVNFVFYIFGKITGNKPDSIKMYENEKNQNKKKALFSEDDFIYWITCQH